MPTKETEATPEDVRDTMFGLLKLANEAGGRIDPHRIARRPSKSIVRAAYAMALDEGLVNDAGYITAAGFRSLGEWLSEATHA